MMDTLHVLLLFLLLLPSTLRGAVPTDQPPAAPSPYTAAGRAQLRAQHDAYFPLLAARAADIAKQADPYSFVSLRPNKISNGGWGNVLWFYMETLAMAMATNRHAVFNNAVLSALFAHPNEAVGTSTNSTSTSTSDTANWHVLSNAEVTAQQQRDQEAGNLTELMPCGHVARRPVAQWGKHFFVHGCFGNNLMHPDVKPALGALLQLQPALDIEQGLFADMAFAHMMRWMLSNPRPLFRAYAEEKVRRVQELCAAGNSKNNSSTRSTDSSSNNSSSSGGCGGGDSAPEYDPIDLAVQIRVFRDNNANNVPQYLNGSYARDVYHSCALQVRPSPLHKPLSAPLCGPYTSPCPALIRGLLTTPSPSLHPFSGRPRGAATQSDGRRTQPDLRLRHERLALGKEACSLRALSLTPSP